MSINLRPIDMGISTSGCMGYDLAFQVEKRQFKEPKGMLDHIPYQQNGQNKYPNGRQMNILQPCYLLVDF